MQESSYKFSDEMPKILMPMIRATFPVLITPQIVSSRGPDSPCPDKVLILDYGDHRFFWYSNYKLIGQRTKKGKHIRVLKAPDGRKRILKEAAFMERYFEELL